jgi:mono/diheme cytochrome c family protein
MQEQPKCTTHGELDGIACDLTPPPDIVALGADFEPARPPLTRALVDRGRNRYTTFCAPCHGIAGDADSDVARAMTLRRPPPLVDATVRAMPDDRIAFVIARGYGVMPGYASALASTDGWAVVAYVRALQAREVPVTEEARRWLH